MHGGSGGELPYLLKYMCISLYCIVHTKQIFFFSCAAAAGLGQKLITDKWNRKRSTLAITFLPEGIDIKTETQLTLLLL